MNRTTSTPNATPDRPASAEADALGRWQQAATLIGDVYSPDAWAVALRESNDWRALVAAVAHDSRAKEAALIGAVWLSDEDEREAGNG